MRCPKLNELPPPPTGKSGWPWTEDTEVNSGRASSHGSRITIVTPSYNSERYLEETVRSVLLQGYPDLEYIVIDGASKDGTTAIIERYSRWITFWASEPDRGYADAVNKGFSRATGEIRAWLPASDLYAPAALFTAERYLCHKKADLIFGRPCIINENSEVLRVERVESKSLLHLSLYGRSCPNQATTFWRSEVHQRAGQLNSNLLNAADSEWFLRLSLIAKCRWIPEVVCRYRQHSGQLSSKIARMRAEWYASWCNVVREQKVSRARILLVSFVFVPLMRFRSGGFKRLFRVPDIAGILATYLAQNDHARKHSG